MSIVCLLSDFGLSDHYVGVMKGVVLGFAPRARLVDLTHQIPTQDVARASFELVAAYRYFPPGTIFLAVVDPGVGTDRRPIALQAAGRLFVGPDNGLFSGVVIQEGGVAEGSQVRLRAGMQAWAIDAQRYGTLPMSETFHGRDLFAPVVGRLCSGLAVSEVGSATEVVRALPNEAGGDRVVAIDRFGNVLTSVRPVAGNDYSLSVGSLTIRGLSRTYADAEDLLLLVSSTGFLEIAARNGNAAKRLGLNVGDSVTIHSQVMTKEQHD